MIFFLHYILYLVFNCIIIIYSDDVTTGAFSSNGVTLMSRNTDSMEVECATTHLTSFAVLVSGESVSVALCNDNVNVLYMKL